MIRDEQRRTRLELIVRMAQAAGGMTRRDVALRVGRDPSNLVGARGLPKIDVAHALARALGWSVDGLVELLLDSDDAPPGGGHESPEGQMEGQMKGQMKGQMEGQIGSQMGSQMGGPTRGRAGEYRSRGAIAPIHEPLSSVPRVSLAEALERAAEANGDGWHTRAASILGAALADRGPDAAPAQIAAALGALAGSRFWLGELTEAMELAACASSRDDTTRLIGATVEALALRDLAERGVVDVPMALRGAELALELCTQRAAREEAPGLAAAGLAPHRVEPMLRAAHVTLPLFGQRARSEQRLEMAMARCRTALAAVEGDFSAAAAGSAETAVPREGSIASRAAGKRTAATTSKTAALAEWRPRAGHTVSRLAVSGTRTTSAGVEGNGVSLPEVSSSGMGLARMGPRVIEELFAATHESLGVAAAVLRWRCESLDRQTHRTLSALLSELRDAVELLEDWPTRRRWFALEVARRSLVERAVGSPTPWPMRDRDLALFAGLIGRYPRDHALLRRVLGSVRVVSDTS
jgi:hypothetical protein